MRALILIILLIASTAWGGDEVSPYAAAGGFGRPEPLGAVGAAKIALAFDEGGAEALLWRDGAVMAVPLGDRASARVVASAQAPTALTVAAGGVVAAWGWRDLRDGAHVVTTSDGGGWRGPQPLAPVGVTTDAGIRWFATGADGDGSHVLEIVAGTPVRRYTTHKRLAGLSAAASPTDAAVHLTWLEGISESGPLGGRAEWSAFGGSIDASASTPIELGRSTPGDAPTATVIAGGKVLRAWTDDRGWVRRSDRPEPLGRGRVLGATEAGAVYRVEGDRIHRHDVDGGSVAVAWSPVVIEAGAALQDPFGITHVAWVGTRAGGERVAFASDDRVAIALHWRDHLAAAFGWHPWTIAEEAGGQAAISVLAAILTAVAATPLLWGAAPLLAGRGGIPRAARRGAIAGVGLAWVVLALLGVAGAPSIALAGGWIALGLASIVGVAVADRVVARRDVERGAAFALAGGLGVACATAILTFAGFDAWLALGWFGSPGGAW